MRFKRWFTMVLLCLAPAAAAQPAADPQAVLARLLQDNKTASMALLALRATADKDLLPLMDALAKSGDRRLRLFAVTSIGELAGKDALPTLVDRIKTDSDNTVRTEALVSLMNLGLETHAVLLEGIKSSDENLQCIAARGLVHMGRMDDARTVLPALSKSKDAAIAAMAKMCLLAIGDKDQLATLRELVRDPKTDSKLVMLLVEHVADQKISAAKDLVEDVLAAAHTEDMVRLRAYKALAAIDKQPVGPRLAKAIAASENRTFQCFALRTVAELPEATETLKALAKDKGLPGILARLELARQDPSLKDVAAPVAEALELGHPIIVEYVLDCARGDAKKHPQAADVYTPALRKLVEAAPRDESRMNKRHIQAALAIKLLAELNSPQSAAGLKEITSGPYDAILRMAATGLYKADDSKLACELAVPLLKSAYDDVRQDAALTLGRNADVRGQDALREIISDASRNPALLAAASWYLLRTQHKTADAAKELAKVVK